MSRKISNGLSCDDLFTNRAILYLIPKQTVGHTIFAVCMIIFTNCKGLSFGNIILTSTNATLKVKLFSNITRRSLLIYSIHLIKYF
jgi:hypothetical protein